MPTREELFAQGAKPMTGQTAPAAATPQRLTREQLLAQGAKAQGAATAPVAPAVAAPQKDALGRVMSGVQAVGSFGEGILKGGIQTALGAGALGEKYLLNPIGQAITGKSPAPSFGAQTLKGGLFTPQGTAEKAGQTTERVLEGVAAGALTGQPFGLTPAGVLGRAGLAAATQGGLEAAHQGDINREVGKSAALAGGTSLAFSGVEAVLKALPQSMWTKILQRTPAEAAKKPGLAAQAAETGMTGIGRNSLVEQSKKAIQQLEVSMDDVLGKTTGTVDSAKVAQTLDGLKAAYANVPGEQGSVDAISAIQQEMASKGVLTPVEANDLKRTIYRIVEKSYGKGMFQTGVKEEAQKEIARGIKQELEAIAPEVKDLNAQQAVYLGMKKALDKTLARQQALRGVAGLPIGLYDLVLGAGGVSALGPQGAALVVGKKVLESTAVRSGLAAMANMFNSLSPTQKVMFYNGLTSLINQKGK